MPVSKILAKNFSQFQGLDLRSSNLIVEPQFSTGMDNAEYNKTNAIVKRKGYQYKADNAGGYGMAVYKDIDTSTGAVTEVVCTVDDSLRTLTSDSFNVTYSGSGTALLTIGVDTSTDKFVLTITEDTTEVLSQNLGLGLDESSATTIATVISAIDALTDFAASGGTVTSGSAAFLDLQNDTVLSSTATAINYVRWSEVNESLANPLTSTQGQKNNDYFENASFAQLNNILYVGTGYDHLHKYDGQTFYRAGMPAGGDADGSGDAGTAAAVADAGSGSTFSIGDDYFYFYLYKQVDNKGNIIEGIPAPYSSKLTKAAADDNAVTVTNLASTSGFNTNCAIVNGAQSGVTTITVDSGHTLNTGDTAYFYDGATSAYVTRVLTGTTSTTITFAGSVNVADNAVISNNLRIAIYRTDEIGAATDASLQTYKLVAEIPNDSIGTSTQVYIDSTTDANLGAEYVAPVKAHGLPPKGSYITTFRSQLFVAGQITNVNTVYYSDIDSPEYFPAGQNSFLVDAFDGAKIRGIAALDTAVIVFKDSSIQSVTGDIADDSFRVDELSYGGIGCVSHNSIQKIGGSLFFLSDKGVYSVSLQGVTPIGARIETEFTKFDVTFNFQKSTAINWVDKDKYVLFIPNESQDGSSNDYADSSSRVYAYDYIRDAWLKWSNVNAQGGFALKTDGTLYFHARRLDSDSSAVERPLAVFNNYGNLNDYTDHQDATNFEYETNWEALGDPQILKKFLRLKIFALPTDVLDGDASLFTLTVDQEINFNSPAAIASFEMDFSGGSAGYGGGTGWGGSSPWGDSPLGELKGKLNSSKSRALKLIMKNSTQKEDVLVSGYQLEVAPSYRPGFKE
jgi:hypothetical protein